MIHEQHREQQVRERAYFIWEGEGRVSGRAEAHWFRAEAELTEAVLSVEPIAEAAVAAPAKALKPAALRTRAKAEKAPAKVAGKTVKKAEAPKAALKARRAPRAGEIAAALH